MGFEHKKGSFTLFRNQKRTKDTHPHLTGEGVDLNGNAIQISVWEKEGRAGTFFSCSMKLKDAAPAGKPVAAQPQRASFEENPDDIIPF